MSETKEALVEQYRRDTIQCAAQRVIAQRGLAGTSMAAIAEEAGVAKGTLYLYFKDRRPARPGRPAASSTSCSSGCGCLAGAASARACELVRTKLASSTEPEFLRVYMARGSAERRGRRQRAAPPPAYARYLEMLTAYSRRGPAR
jgi:AcrR family transcriptional regulator